MNIKIQRRLLQLLIALGACVPVAAGACGMWFGVAMLQEAGKVSVDLDSHFRYLSGLLFAIGVAFWNLLPWIEQERAVRYTRLLTLVVMIGGLGRLYAAVFVAWPSVPMQLALVMELVMTPALYLWQRHIAKAYAAQPV